MQRNASLFLAVLWREPFAVFTKPLQKAVFAKSRRKAVKRKKIMRHNQLPVYKTTYDLLLASFGYIKHFPREYKYTLGEKIKEELMELTCELFRVNISSDKTRWLTKCRESIETVRLLWRIVKDLKIINVKKYTQISQYITSISKQITAWQRSCEKNGYKK